MDAAKDGNLKGVYYLLAYRQGKSRECCIIPPVIPRCPETQSASMSIHALAPQAAPRVEPGFPLSLWIRVRREMLAQMVTVSGHRGPGALKPLRRCTARPNPTPGYLIHTSPLDTGPHAQHTRTPLHPTALASVPYGVALVRVRVNLETGNLEPQDAQGWSRAHPARPRANGFFIAASSTLLTIEACC